MLKNLKMKPKMIGLFLLVGLIPLAVVGWLASGLAGKALRASAFGELEAVREIKRGQIGGLIKNHSSNLDVLVSSVSTFRNEAFNRLSAIRETKRVSIENHFKGIEGHMLTFSRDRMVVEAMEAFAGAFPQMQAENLIEADQLARMKEDLRTYYTEQFSAEYARQNNGASIDTDKLIARLGSTAIVSQYHYIQNNPGALGAKHEMDRASDGSTYSQIHGDIHPILRDYLKQFGYYDIFFVDAGTGDIVYTVFKELDFGTNLLTGPYAETNLGEAFRQARDSEGSDTAILTDYKQYPPSYEAAASFIATPIYAGGRKIGVAIFQLSIDKLNETMGVRAGLGETGESYLVGPDHLMRSDSHLDPEHRSVLASFRNPSEGSVTTDAVEQALAGSTDVGVIVDYRGNPVLSAYAPVTVGTHTWALAVEIDVAEAFVPKDVEGHAFYDRYVNLFGYYDVFLLNPDGYCYYTQAREADYQTNLATGPYKDSNLGVLFREVMASKSAGFADFAPYAPSEDKPAAFIAQPVLRDGAVETVVALQIPLTEINAVMQERTGMGETGESYLVGPDKLMRSDSFLDTVHHTVEASFADPEAGDVDTEASTAALAGESGARVVTDYNGHRVLSAFAPVEVFGKKWALLAEIDEAEVNEPISALIRSILIAAGIAGGIVAVLAFFIAVTIVAPLLKGVDFVQVVSGGDFTQQSSVDQKDEVGILVRALNRMAATLRSTIQQVVSHALTIASSSREMAGTAGTMTRSAEEMTHMAHSAAASTEEASANLQNIAAGIEEMSANSNTVAAASEEVSANLITVGAAIEEMATNMSTIAERSKNMSASVNTVSAAVTEMSASLGGVSESTRRSSDVAAKAVEQASSTVRTVAALNESVKKIESIVEIITSIASQTNLLALNATIEAASAGEAGKGFAVVAAEVKELASQTSKATSEIRQFIDQIQTDTRLSTEAIAKIEGVVRNLNGAFAEINAAVSEQSKAVNEISMSVADTAEGTNEVSRTVDEAAAGVQEITRNVQQASMGMNDIARNIGELAAVSNEISKNAGEASLGMSDTARIVASVNSAAESNKKCAQEMSDSASSMETLSLELEALMKQFKV
ncbi:MAG: methyl-accepting chemotaxis protein [Candidatus Hydrogenedentes bacterium]|nr:methyl-accepting chemotaxis protein [Candidatus Hydrogenedentota bacterium]